MFDTIGAPELILILVIILVVFGAGKLPEIGAAMGKAIHEFKKESKQIETKPGPGNTAPASDQPKQS